MCVWRVLMTVGSPTGVQHRPAVDSRGHGAGGGGCYVPCVVELSFFAAAVCTQERAVMLMPAGIFDVIGPIMVGPSSSHTAGAVRLGNIARRIGGEGFTWVDFYLHGSFAQTYRGHGSDRALLGGTLGFAPSDEAIRDAFEYAQAHHIGYTFQSVDLGVVHPNTAKIVLSYPGGRQCEVIGSSTGGGNIVVSSIDSMTVEFTGRYPALITCHDDRPGVVASAASALSSHHINIAFLRVFRQARGAEACMVIEMDQDCGPEVIDELQQIHGVRRVIATPAFE